MPDYNQTLIANNVIKQNNKYLQLIQIVHNILLKQRISYLHDNFEVMDLNRQLLTKTFALPLLGRKLLGSQ